MYKINEIIEVNDDCEVSEYVPGIILFGGNGGGEYFAFDYRGSEIKYIIIPSMLDYDDIIIQSTTLKEFFKRLYNGMIFEN
ncbi:SMI1/KNR4 family protein [Clostridium sp. YIM B02569]|uniref:SMI1/KNR4 family protein n=1 Tax=Clostridium sp. YIM B02569 TaxID=2911967 RepID=UPI001EEDC117|nr:SMI1/KNR4 family protein [Clostridium sp. YIM B02569]